MTTNPTSTSSRLNESSIHISDIIRVLKKYGIYMIGLMVLGGTLASIYARFQPSQYDAIALLHLDQHNSISIGSAGAASDDYSLKMQTQIVGLQHPNVVVATMKKLNLAANPIFNPSLQQDLSKPALRDQLVGRFLASLSITSVPKTELISIRFRSTSPVLAALVANTLVDTYFDESLNQRIISTQRIASQLTVTIDKLKDQIQGEQNELLESEAKLGILSQGGGLDSSVLGNETSGLLSQRVKAQADRYFAEAEYQDLLDHPDAAIPNDLPGNATLSQLQTQLTQTEAQVASLESRYGPNYEPLKQLKAQVSTLQQNVKSEHEKVLKGAAENFERYQKVEASINDRLDALQKLSQDRTPDTVRFEILKSKYVSDQTLYNLLLSAIGTGQIQAGMQSQVLNRFSTAIVPGVKAYPNVQADTMAGAAAGFVVSLLIVGIILLNSDTVQTVEHIEETLPLPILASVPEYKDDLAAMRISDDVLPLVTLLAPRSAGTEAYRLLRTAITLMPVSQKHRVISLTSCGPGEGKSTTTMNLAVVLATQAKRVLLIDADLRKPTIAQRLKLPATDQPGLSRYLSDSTVLPEDCIQKVPEVSGLDVMPVQEVPPFPSELLGQGRLEQLLAWARDHYDYVLIDTPPVLLVTDALIIATHCDTLLVVVRIGVAQKRGLRRIRQDLAKYPGKQTGIIVNALPFADTYYGGYGNYRKYYGGKGYGGYGGYGGKGTYYGSGSGAYISPTPGKKKK